MGSMTEVAQMGSVIVDGRGTIRVQRADIDVGPRAGHIAEILRRLAAQGRRGAPQRSQSGPHRVDRARGVGDAA
jgi:hypothetical protein